MFTNATTTGEEMKFGIDWSQNSTKRGAIWLVFGVIGIVGWVFGKDVTALMPLGAAVAGGMGVAIKD
jgi:hypothetical protein